MSEKKEDLTMVTLKEPIPDLKEEQEEPLDQGEIALKMRELSIMLRKWRESGNNDDTELADKATRTCFIALYRDKIKP